MAKKTPPKPYATFPLFAHAKGYWAKKIGGRQVSFGKWVWPDEEAYRRSWREALDRYKRHDEDQAVRERIGSRPDEVTLGTLINWFLTMQEDRARATQISPRMFYEYRIVLAGPAPDANGKKPAAVTPCLRDFIGAHVRLSDLEREPQPVRAYIAEMDRRLGWHAFNKRMALIAAMLNASAKGMTGIFEKPLKLAGLFEKRPEKSLRKERRIHDDAHGPKIIPAAELAAMVRYAPQPLRAMILLGYFCAYGQSDCADLVTSRVNFRPDPGLGLGPDWGVIVFPRPKTEIDRAAVIPPIVTRALREAIEARPSPSNLAFVTERGHPYVRDVTHAAPDGSIARVTTIDAIGDKLARLRARISTCPDRHAYQVDAGDACCLVCREMLAPLPRMGFYRLRHQAITDAAGAADMDALTRWQGHSLPGMRRHYVMQIEAGRLKKIADCLLARLTEFELG